MILSKLLARMLLVLGAAAFFGLLGCVQTKEKANTGLDYDSPKGALAPVGVEKIKEGMAQATVLAILDPLYPVMHAADAEPTSPIADFFPYTEDGKTKYLEIIYLGDRVYRVRFGYEETHVIE